MASARDACGGGVLSARMASSAAAFQAVTTSARTADAAVRTAAHATIRGRMDDVTFRVSSVFENLERQTDVRRPAVVGAERLLNDLALRAAKPAAAAENRPVRDHADLSEAGFEALGPDRVGVPVEHEHLRGVESDVLGRQVARKDALANPSADASGLTRVADSAALLQRANREDPA